jgi:hypothetical protein
LHSTVTQATEAEPAIVTPLVARLQAAAVEALGNLATAIDGNVGHLRSVTVELEIANNGGVLDSRAFVERRGVHRQQRAARKGEGQ